MFIATRGNKHIVEVLAWNLCGSACLELGNVQLAMLC